MRQHPTLQLLLIPCRWFRVNSLLDITVKILRWIQWRQVRRQIRHLYLSLMRFKPVLYNSTTMHWMTVYNPQQFPFALSGHFAACPNRRHGIPPTASEPETLPERFVLCLRAKGGGRRSWTKLTLFAPWQTILAP